MSRLHPSYCDTCTKIVDAGDFGPYPEDLLCRCVSGLEVLKRALEAICEYGDQWDIPDRVYKIARDALTEYRAR